MVYLLWKGGYILRLRQHFVQCRSPRKQCPTFSLGWNTVLEWVFIFFLWPHPNSVIPLPSPWLRSHLMRNLIFLWYAGHYFLGKLAYFMVFLRLRKYLFISFIFTLCSVLPGLPGRYAVFFFSLKNFLSSHVCSPNWRFPSYSSPFCLKWLNVHINVHFWFICYIN